MIACTYLDPLLYEHYTFLQANTRAEWRSTMQAEINALLHNHTWTLVPSPSNVNEIGNNFSH